MIFGRRKHQAERDRAAAMVRDAAAAGRITALDRDRRLQELEYAGTEEEVESYVRDLRLPVDEPSPWQAPAPHTSAADRREEPRLGHARGAGLPSASTSGPTSGPHTGLPWPPRAPGGPQVERSFRASLVGAPRHPARPYGGTVTHALRPKRRNRGCLLVGVVVGFVFVAAPMIGAFALFWAVDQDAVPDSPAAVESDRATQSLFDDSSWRELVAAFEAETGSDRVSAAIVYDDWAVVTAAEESGGFSYHYDGETLHRTSRLDYGIGEFSLRDIEMAGLRAGLERAQRGVGDLRNRYLHIWQRDRHDPPLAVGHVLGAEANHTVHLSLAGAIVHCDC